MKEYPWGKGTPTWVRDATANDSDKSFTVPAGKVWNVRYIMATLSATATVGTRNINVNLTDGTDVIYTSVRVSPTASQVGQLLVGVGVPPSTAQRARLDSPNAVATVETDSSLPDVMLSAGYVVRVYDFAAIDAAADDMTVVLHYVEYDA